MSTAHRSETLPDTVNQARYIISIIIWKHSQRGFSFDQTYITWSLKTFPSTDVTWNPNSLCTGYIIIDL